jgi:hypothetical protein
MEINPAMAPSSTVAESIKGSEKEPCPKKRAFLRMKPSSGLRDMEQGWVRNMKSRRSEA